MKKHNKFCTRTYRNFLENFIIKPHWLSMAKSEHTLHFWKLRWRLCYRNLSQNDLNWFKNRLETCVFADRKYFYLINPERFFSSLKKTIVLYIVKNLETLMFIFTSGRRRVFVKKMILYISFRDNPFSTEFASLL